MDESRLREVDARGLREVVQVLKKNFDPASLLVWGTIQQNVRDSAVIQGQLFVDEWPSFNVVVFEIQNFTQQVHTTVPPVIIYAKCCAEKLKDIIQGSHLQSLYRNRAEFHATDPRCLEIVRELGAPFGFCPTLNVQPIVCALTDIKCLGQHECPVGYYMAPIQHKDVELICKTWKHATATTYKRVMTFVDHSLTAGIYTADANELVAWAVVMEYGAIGMLQTLEGHRQKGLAKCIISHLASEVAKQDMIPFCLIENSNALSKLFFKKMGFTLFAEVSVVWIKVVPA